MSYYYYLFRLDSSRGTHEITVRTYKNKPSDDKLKKDLEDWIKSFSCDSSSENILRYSARKIPDSRIPRSRKKCLARFDTNAKQFAKIREEKQFLLALLRCPQFSR